MISNFPTLICRSQILKFEEMRLLLFLFFIQIFSHVEGQNIYETLFMAKSQYDSLDKTFSSVRQRGNSIFYTHYIQPRHEAVNFNRPRCYCQDACENDQDCLAYSLENFNECTLFHSLPSWDDLVVVDSKVGARVYHKIVNNNRYHTGKFFFRFRP